MARAGFEEMRRAVNNTTRTAADLLAMSGVGGDQEFAGTREASDEWSV